MTGNRLLLCVFLPFAAGYFISYLFRVVNAVIATGLAAELGLSAGILGLLTSAYFLAFAAFQLPLGVLLDRYGPRRVEALLLLVAALGSLVFALGQGAASLTLGRALIGLGVSACLMASFKAFVQWFPAERLPLVNGCLLAFGGLGAMAGTVPVDVAVNHLGWRQVFALLAFACVACALLIGWLVPERPAVGRSEPLRRQVGALVGIFGHAWFWSVAPLAALAMGSSLAIQGLWAGPWLRDVAGMESGAVASALLLMAVAMTVGFAGWGWLAERLGRRGIPLGWVAVAGVVTALAGLGVLALQPSRAVVPFWMAYTFAATSGTLFYVLLSRSFAPALAGRVNTALNLLIFVSAFLIQWLLGLVVQLWDSTPGGGYDAAGYRVAFAALVILQGLALAWFLRGLRRVRSDD